MKKASCQNEKGPGTLYIVATPIGNLEDMTLRALRILKNVGLIAAEGVQHSKALCRHYGIWTPLTSYNQHNQKVKGIELIRRLRSGSDVALVTNAGTPGLSDPGASLVHQAMGEGIKVSPVPGSSALTAALSVSGVRGDGFLFLGFLSSRPAKRRKELKSLVSEPKAMVLFEAPHRIRETLGDMLEILGDREIVLLRELTKRHEEIKRGLLSPILQEMAPDKIKGEFTLIVSGKGKSEKGSLLDERTRKKIERLLKERKETVKDIAARLSTEEGLPYRRIYKECLATKRAMGSSDKGS